MQPQQTKSQKLVSLVSKALPYILRVWRMVKKPKEPQVAPEVPAIQEVQVQYVSRLSPDVYRKFEERLPRAVLDKGSVDAGVDAGYRLGIQFVLDQLRRELVVS